MSESHPTDSELLHAAIATIRDVLAPELRTAWAEASATQLIGLLEYAAGRDPGRASRQDAELAAATGSLQASHEVLAGPAFGASALERTSALLVYAQSHADAAAAAVRAELRPIVLRHAAEDLAESGPLLQSFALGSRGLDPDAE